MSIFGRISTIYANKNKRYNRSYFFNNHIRWLNLFRGFFVKQYYQYVAAYVMAKPARLKKNARVLDIGCGVGILVEQFNKLGYQAFGIDINKEAIENSICPKNCFLVQTAAKLPYPDDYFSLVASREVLEHIPASHIDACIDEWDRVSVGKMIHIIAVKERGSSAIDDPMHVNVQSEKWWIEKFRKHGYRTIRKPQKFFFSHFGSKGYLMFVKDD